MYPQVTPCPVYEEIHVNFHRPLAKLWEGNAFTHVGLYPHLGKLLDPPMGWCVEKRAQTVTSCVRDLDWTGIFDWLVNWLGNLVLRALEGIT